MGRHSKPNRAAGLIRKGSVVAVGAGSLLALGTGVAVPTASAAPLDVIAGCESGNRNVNNASGSSASGYYQIIDSTWRAYGGTQFASRAINATAAQQRIVAERIAAARGSYADWNASKSCWGGKLNSTSVPSVSKAGASAASASKSYQVRKGGVTTGRGKDGRGSAVCTPSLLYFDACDPGNLGEVFQYPKYDGR